MLGMLHVPVDTGETPRLVQVVMATPGPPTVTLATGKPTSTSKNRSEPS